jgi:hypothetical protein
MDVVKENDDEQGDGQGVRVGELPSSWPSPFDRFKEQIERTRNRERASDEHNEEASSDEEETDEAPPTAPVSRGMLLSFDTLPDDVVTMILANCHLISRLKLEQTCRRAQSCLLSHGPFWTNLEFEHRMFTYGSDMYTLFQSATARLQDEQLSALLTRCQAAKRSVNISLRNCVALTGSGLLPLRDSCVLESVNLRVKPRYQNVDIRLDPDVVCGILASMMPPTAVAPGFPNPYKLAKIFVTEPHYPNYERGEWLTRAPTRYFAVCSVRLRFRSFTTPRLLPPRSTDEAWRSILEQLDASVAGRAVRDAVKCGHCERAVSSGEAEG